MPELPEVESVRAALVRARIRALVVRVWRSRKALRTGRAWERKHERLQQLMDARPGRVRRRGKYLIWEFESGRDEPLGLLIHLGMTGQCSVEPADAPCRAHTHFRLRFADDREFRFSDPRRFGGLRAARLAELAEQSPLSELGPEPLGASFGGELLADRAGQSKRAIRDVLLDQRVIAGVGNIYAVEALYLARLHPGLAAARLQDGAWQRLATAIRQVLTDSIEHGGTTFRDFRNLGGEPGAHASSLWVYGRAGEPCRRCGHTLRAFTLGGRSGVLCPREQRATRIR